MSSTSLSTRASDSWAETPKRTPSTRVQATPEWRTQKLFPEWPCSMMFGYQEIPRESQITLCQIVAANLPMVGPNLKGQLLHPMLQLVLVPRSTQKIAETRAVRPQASDCRSEILVMRCGLRLQIPAECSTPQNLVESERVKHCQICWVEKWKDPARQEQHLVGTLRVFALYYVCCLVF